MLYLEANKFFHQHQRDQTTILLVHKQDAQLGLASD